MRILLIEDEPVLGEAVLTHLKRSNHAVDWVQRLDDAEAALRAVDYGLVLLDLHLPDGRGLDLLRNLRKEEDKRPVIILTARDQIRDRIEGLNAGADDYIVKPFSPGELVARARAVLRRSGAQEDPAAGPQVLGGIELLPAERTVRVDGVLADLTPKEFELLHYLLVNRGLALTRERLLEEVWGYNSYGDARTVDVHVGQLRRKLGSWGPIIQTVWGLGYRADPEATR